MKTVIACLLLTTACATTPVQGPVQPAKSLARNTHVLGAQTDMGRQAQAFCGAESWSLKYTSFDKTEAIATCSGQE